MKSRSAIRVVIVCSVVLFVALMLTRQLTAQPRGRQISLLEFQREMKADNIVAARLYDRDHMLRAETQDGGIFELRYPSLYGEQITQQALEAGVPLEVDNQSPNILLGVFTGFLPILLILLVLGFLFRGSQGGNNPVMSFGKAKPKINNKEDPQVTFVDVAGVDEAIEEIQEIKDFLMDPAKFQEMGAKIPKGVLLVGPPGTGKTLLGRAVAGEAGVPFFSISGSDFVEMFVGVGASRVRDLFKQAKESAPAIIFMDEIDAVGRHRGAGYGGGNDEREQTLNQLLVELDGFDQRLGIILIAATNRPDILDPALLRPGRFDRQIVVDRPDLLGRRAILNVHARGKPLAKEVDLDVIARRTPGFTGADLANLMNEGTLLATRGDRKEVNNKDLEEAIDRVVAGPERRTRIISDKEKLVIAYHESGHAIVGHALPGTDPVHKVTIIPRGRALGITMTVPTEDKYLQTRSELTDQLSMMLGGRAAEELIFADPSTGASNDIERATQVAKDMITTYGMSDALGPMQFGRRSQEMFLPRDLNSQRDYSDEVAASIDKEVRRLIESAHSLAHEILKGHRGILDKMAEALIDHETLDTAEVQAIMAPIPKWTNNWTSANGAHDPVALAKAPAPAPAGG